ncbi:hypothetical protein IFM89_023711 [Coptis chinensis]|uniref:F-box domain-containing protein n=1 Tax=Coptis chinensis TaxID=261450 RepID=A0A835HCQ6_9MAGN|nr:hypothetical protein IFM89_023711 [Coptis chinensis]
MRSMKRRRRRGGGEEAICWDKGGQQQVNWLDMPSDVMLVILFKLDVFQILCYAQFVCSSWLQLAKDPFLYRSILVPDRYNSKALDLLCSNNKKGMVLGLRVLKDAVKRSSGELKEISLAKSWCTDDLLLTSVMKNMTGTYLKSLKLASFREITRNQLTASAFRKLHFLEELELKDNDAFILDSGYIIQIVSRSCPRLKYFSFINNIGDKRFESCCEGVAFTIADCMPHLRGLRLYLTCLTNQGLRAIIKGCPHLENLDLRGCCYNDLQEDLQKECLKKIRDLSLPSSNVAPLRLRQNFLRACRGRISRPISACHLARVMRIQ